MEIWVSAAPALESVPDMGRETAQEFSVLCVEPEL